MGSKTAVFVHFYYQDLLDEFLDYLDNFPNETDIFFNAPSRPKDALLEIQDKLELRFPRATLLISWNKGKDIGGLFHIYAYLKHQRLTYDYVCILHTKKNVLANKINRFSPEYGDNWRKRMISSIAGSKATVLKMIDILDRQPQIGMIGCEEYRDNFMGTALEHISRYADKLGIVIEPPRAGELSTLDVQRPRDERVKSALSFFAGTMFWARWPILEQAFDKLGIDPEREFDNENVDDGKPQHAFERLLGYAVSAAGYELLGVPTDIPAIPI